MFMRDKPNFSSEKMLHQDYDHKGSVEKIKSLVVSLEELDAKTNRLTVKTASRKVTLSLTSTFESFKSCNCEK
jgi:hypothetical protein